MNERIKQLVRQAVESVDIVTGNESLDDELAKMYIPDCFSEKFAELIVRECAELAKHHVMNISTYGDAEFVDEQIKQHFGIEP